MGYAVTCVWGDYDNDGWLDLFVTNFGNGGKNRLYHNNGDGTFERVTTGSIATDLTLDFEDAEAANFPRRFYRARQVNQ